MSYYDTDGTDPPARSNPIPVDRRASSLPIDEFLEAAQGLDEVVAPAMASLRETARVGLAGTGSGQEDR